MEPSAIPIAYFDEHEIWPRIQEELASRTPVSYVELHSNGFLESLPNLPVEFIPHSKANWHVPTEDSYKKPFLWIYVLVAPTYEYFRKEQKDPLKRWISNMTEERIE